MPFQKPSQLSISAIHLIAQAGPPAEIYDRPATPFVASFVGGTSVLIGHVREGRAHLGSLHVAAPATAREGEAVRAFVRPHDIKLVRTIAGNGVNGVASSRVERLKPMGGYVKVLLKLPTGDTVTVEVPRSEFDQLGVVEGDSVRALECYDGLLFVERTTRARPNP